MGKGVIPDDHPLVVSAARSKVLGRRYFYLSEKGKFLLTNIIVFY